MEIGIHSNLKAPKYRLEIRGGPDPSLTVATYGYSAELARQAALRLAYEHEVFIEIIVMTDLIGER